MVELRVLVTIPCLLTNCAQRLLRNIHTLFNGLTVVLEGPFMCVDDALINGKVTVQCMHYKLYVQIIKVNLIAYPSVKKEDKACEHL